jgi:4-hydroxy 2-oxovalerate aldolase
VPVIEVSHGDGLGGSSFNYGFSATDERRLIAAAVEEAGRARIASLLVPGIGRVADLEAAAGLGVSIARIATHCTEADVSIQHFRAARELGLETVGFLMMAHMAEPAELARQARIMVDAGCQCPYVVDSADALVLDEVTDRVAAVVAEVGEEAMIGFHAHDNLGVAVANSVLAYRAGARQLDGSLRGLEAGAGNAKTEFLATVLDRLDISTGVDPRAAIDAAEEVIGSFVPHGPFTDRGSIMPGYAGAYSSFLRHAETAVERYEVDAHEILMEAGRRGYVGGQEDLIIDIAIGLREAA